MKLCLDSGNSRIKWGIWHAGCWQESGSLKHDERPRLREIAHRHPGLTRILLANVAGEAALNDIRAQLAGQVPVEVVRSLPEACGVRNGYDTPARLGVDRWCALIGAQALQPGGCVVVMAGTATTIDALSPDGDFLGGLILPGLDLMHRALAQGTADLPVAGGRHREFPRCTDDAIASGALEAHAGAVERMLRRCAPGSLCLLSGGNAPALSAVLDLPHRCIDNLPLEGLRCLADEHV